MSLALSRSVDSVSPRAAVVDRLRASLPVLEGMTASGPLIPFQQPAIDRCLFHKGLVAGALHEGVPATPGDWPAALGFALASIAPAPSQAPWLFVTTSEGGALRGLPYGPGLRALGLDPGRLLLFHAEDCKAALWVIEEALRARCLTAVIGLLDADLDLKTSRRLHLAAAASDSFLWLLRPAHRAVTGAALSRWRIAAAPGRRDPFDTLTHWRCRATLERSRNGRTGSWIMEWDHVAHRFHLAGTLADQPFPEATASAA